MAKRSQPMAEATVNVEAAASFTHSGILYRRGDVLPVTQAQAADLVALHFAIPTDRSATAPGPPESQRDRYARRDMRPKD